VASIQPSNGSLATLSQGYSVGAWTAVLASHGVDVSTVHVQTWKKALGLIRKDKAASMRLALQVLAQARAAAGTPADTAASDAAAAAAVARGWPGGVAAEDMLRSKKHHGRAEALLLAAWGLGWHADADASTPAQGPLRAVMEMDGGMHNLAAQSRARQEQQQRAHAAAAAAAEVADSSASNGEETDADAGAGAPARHTRGGGSSDAGQYPGIPSVTLPQLLAMSRAGSSSSGGSTYRVVDVAQALAAAGAAKAAAEAAKQADVRQRQEARAAAAAARAAAKAAAEEAKRAAALERAAARALALAAKQQAREGRAAAGRQAGRATKQRAGQ
jgi:SWI/SNF-related matrix-associated actin-dependent regulator 1 of chromatin subfamily A